MDALTAKLAAVDAARRACEQDKAPVPHPPSWWESPGVALVGGVLVGIGLTVAVVEAVR